MTNDMTPSTKPKTDQLNFDDFTSGPMNITITGVNINPNADMQPVSVYFEGDNNKPWKPCKSMCRVMVKGWGKDANAYVGRSLTLYGDGEVTFGKMKVGGIRISHMSHIDEGFVMALTVTKARRAAFPVKVLEVAPTLDAEQVKDIAKSAASLGMDKYKEHFASLDAESRTLIIDSGDHDKNKTTANETDSKNDL